MYDPINVNIQSKIDILNILGLRKISIHVHVDILFIYLICYIKKLIAKQYKDIFINILNMINGLTITPNFISQDYEQELIKNILDEPWNTDLNRRTQHYGYKYNYRNQNISSSDYLGEFPEWLNILTDYVTEKAKLERKPDQIIINEYFPGQGISPHTDVKTIFDNHICSLSLGSNVMMHFTQQKSKIDYYLERCSLLEICDDARYKWMHSIVGRKTDKIDGQNMNRSTRYSITFRKVILSE